MAVTKVPDVRYRGLLMIASLLDRQNPLQDRKRTELVNPAMMARRPNDDSLARRFERASPGLIKRQEGQREGLDLDALV